MERSSAATPRPCTFAPCRACSKASVSFLVVAGPQTLAGEFPYQFMISLTLPMLLSSTKTYTDGTRTELTNVRLATLCYSDVCKIDPQFVRTDAEGKRLKEPPLSLGIELRTSGGFHVSPCQKANVYRE